jgi:hypothetical protein
MAGTPVLFGNLARPRNARMVTAQFGLAWLLRDHWKPRIEPSRE